MCKSEEKIKNLYNQFFINRISGNWPPNNSKWNTEYPKNRKGKSLIKEHLEKGHKIKTGYYCTSVKGIHIHVLFWKD